MLKQKGKESLRERYDSKDGVGIEKLFAGPLEKNRGAWPLKNQHMYFPNEWYVYAMKKKLSPL